MNWVLSSSGQKFKYKCEGAVEQLAINIFPLLVEVKPEIAQVKVTLGGKKTAEVVL